MQNYKTRQPLQIEDLKGNSISSTPMSARKSMVAQQVNSLNPESSSCHRCSQPISEAHLKVGSYAFHKEHFNCAVCEISLQGQRFFNRDNDFFCLSHFEERYLHTCPGCNEKIRPPGKSIKALGFHYHEKCFKCTTCEKHLSGKFFSHKNKPYCEEHAPKKENRKLRSPSVMILTPDQVSSLQGNANSSEENTKNSSSCAQCNQAITQEDESCIIAEKYYHRECLKCSYCSRMLGNKSGDKIYFLKEGKNLACEEDFKLLHTNSCVACGLAITGEMLFINKGEYYHHDCFRCKICDKKLETYLSVGGELRCPNHISASNADLTCAACKDEIEINKVCPAIGNKYHQDCLVCSFCSKKLDSVKAKCNNGNLSCTQCILAQRRANNSPISHSRLDINFGPSPKSRNLSMDELKLVDKKKPLPSPDDKRPRRSVSRNPRPGSASPIISGDTFSSEYSPARVTINIESSPGNNRDDSKTQNDTKNSILRESLSMLSPMSSPLRSKVNSSTFRRPKIRNWKRGEMIGRGQFGKVYSGLLENGQWIAVKQMEIRNEEDKAHVKAMEKEVQLMEKLRHENIVSLLGSQKDDTNFFILMEYVPGKSLDILLKNFGPFNEVTISNSIH